MPKTEETFSETLRRLRGDLTQEVFCSFIPDLSVWTYRSWENKRREDVPKWVQWLVLRELRRRLKALGLPHK